MLQRALLAGMLCLAAATADADTVVLENGDELTGEIVEWSVDHVVLDHPQLGRIRLSLEKLKLDTGKPPNPGFFGTNFLRGWKRRIEFGLNGKEGNSVSSNITSGLKFAYEDDWTRWKLEGRYYYHRSDDGDADNNARLDLLRDWLFPDSRWYWSVGGRYNYDEFESWQHRLTVFGAVGLNLLRSEAHDLRATLGPAFTREFGTSGANKVETLFGMEYGWKVSDRLSLSLGNQLFIETRPKAGALRNLTTAKWSVSITERPALSLNLGFENEYESQPDPGDVNNDLFYFATLGLDL